MSRRYYISSALGATTSFRWTTTAGGTKICWSDTLNKQVQPSLCPKEEESAVKAGAKAALSFLTEGWRQEGALRAARAQQPQSTTPSWLLPVGLGVAAIGIVLIAKKK